MVLRVVVMLAIGGRLAWLGVLPIARPHHLVRINKDDEVLIGGFGNLRIDLAAGRIVGNVAFGIGLALEDLHTALFGNGAESIELAVYIDSKLCRVTIPSQLLDA